MKNGNSFASTQRERERERERESEDRVIFNAASTSTFSLSGRVTQRGSLFFPFLSFPFHLGGLFAEAAGEIIISPIDRVANSRSYVDVRLSNCFENNGEQRAVRRGENFLSEISSLDLSANI